MTTETQREASCSESPSAYVSGPFSPRRSDARPNVPVPDELNTVREEIKRLTAREAELRRLLLLHPDLRTGAAWRAEVSTVQQMRTDWKELRKAHPQIVEQYEFSMPVTRVVLSGVTEDGEVVSARRQRRLLKGE